MFYTIHTYTRAVNIHEIRMEVLTDINNLCNSLSLSAMSHSLFGMPTNPLPIKIVISRTPYCKEKQNTWEGFISVANILQQFLKNMFQKVLIIEVAVISVGQNDVWVTHGITHRHRESNNLIQGPTSTREHDYKIHYSSCHCNNSWDNELEESFLQLLRKKHKYILVIITL